MEVVAAGTQKPRRALGPSTLLMGQISGREEPITVSPGEWRHRLWLLAETLKAISGRGGF